MFPTNSERLIGVSDAFSAFVYGYPSSCPRAHCTPNKACLLCATPAGLDLYIQTMPVGTYRVQSPGFPKIVYLINGSTRSSRTSHQCHTPSPPKLPQLRCHKLSIRPPCASVLTDGELVSSWMLTSC